MHQLPLEQYPYIVLTPTDTATPYHRIPIFYIHTLQQPFCRNSSCKCHRRQQEIAKLLGHITEGIMTLREAASLIDGERIEGEG